MVKYLLDFVNLWTDFFLNKVWYHPVNVLRDTRSYFLVYISLIHQDFFLPFGIDMYLHYFSVYYYDELFKL
jgi:hypothetical protein